MALSHKLGWAGSRWCYPLCERSRRLTPAQLAVLKEWIEAGPDPAVDGVVRWRCADLVAKIAAEFDVVYFERGVAALLNRLGFRATLYVRPGGWPMIGYGHVVRDHDRHLFEHGIDNRSARSCCASTSRPRSRRSDDHSFARPVALPEAPQPVAATVD